MSSKHDEQYEAIARWLIIATIAGWLLWRALLFVFIIAVLLFLTKQ